MASPGKFEEEALASLQRAVSRALERKRRLGQYAVFWENGRVVFDGPDAPISQEGAGSQRSVEPEEASEPEAGGHLTRESPET